MCHIAGVGSVEAGTAQRHACDSPLLGVIVDAQAQLAVVDSFQHPDAATIRPRWTGEPFDLHACVQALFTIKLPEQSQSFDQQAA